MYIIMDINLDHLKKSYFEWATNRIKINKKDDYVEIVTPFVDQYNDAITLYLSKNGDEFVLDDDGYTLSELATLGLDFKQKGRRQTFFKETIKNFGIEVDKNNILKTTSKEQDDIPNVQMRLTQAIITINDMLMLSRSNVSRIFLEDVTNYFLDKDIPITEHRNILGKSGSYIPFEVEIGRTRKRNSSIFKVVNRPSGSEFSNPLFNIMDTMEAEPQSDFFVIANDDKEISPKFSQAFKNYDIDVLPWSEREKWILKFA